MTYCRLFLRRQPRDYAPHLAARRAFQFRHAFDFNAHLPQALRGNGVPNQEFISFVEFFGRDDPDLHQVQPLLYELRRNHMRQVLQAADANNFAPVRSKDDVLQPSGDFPQYRKMVPAAGAPLCRPGPAVTDIIADQWLHSVEKTGANDAPFLAGRQRLALLVHDFYDAEIHADVQSAVLALRRQHDILHRTILFIGPGAEGLLDCVGSA